MITIKKQFVPQSIVNSRSHGKGNTMRYIVIHETANINTGANAQAHSNLQTNKNRREASWHYTVDDKTIIQNFEDNIKVWHAGNKGNREGIAIEICVNRDGDFKKAVDNAVALTKILMGKHNIPISRVKQHNFFTGKNCPTNLRNGSKGVNWSQFVSKVDGKKVELSKPSSKPKKPAKSSKGADMKTNSIVTYLQSIGEPWSISHRKKLAKKHGIKNYSGKSVQNLILLDKMRKSGGKKPPSKQSKANLKVDGYMGKATIKALQSYYKTPVDGVLSKPSLVVKKLQATVGTKVDGYMGRNTIIAMQKYFGTPQDGVLSKPSLVIKKLQSALNKGKI